MIVVDTHILIWDALQPEKLSLPAKEAIAEANQGEGLLICDISLWEIGMLIAKGRIQVEVDTQTFLHLLLQANKTAVFPITPEIATLSVQLPPEINKDPADRLIAATALNQNLPLLTADQNLRASKRLNTIW